MEKERMTRTEIKDELIKLRHRIALLRKFPSMAPELEFDRDETAGIAWSLDCCILVVDKVINKIDTVE